MGNLIWEPWSIRIKYIIMNKKPLILISLIGILLLNSCKERNVNSSAGEINYTRTIMDISVLGPGFLASVNEKIYHAVTAGKISAYANDSLLESSKMTLEEAKKAGSLEEAIELVPDPDYPDYFIDTVITHLFRLTDITGYEISHVWSINTGSNTYSVAPNAFAITYKPVIAGVELNEMPLFWIAYSDLEALTGSENYKSLNKLVYQKTTERVSDY